MLIMWLPANIGWENEMLRNSKKVKKNFQAKVTASGILSLFYAKIYNFLTLQMHHKHIHYIPSKVPLVLFLKTGVLTYDWLYLYEGFLSHWSEKKLVFIKVE